MGLRYSYEVIAPLPCAERLVRAVVKHLIPDDQDRLLAAWVTGPDGIQHMVQRHAHDFWSGDVCLVFLFPSDDQLAASKTTEGCDDPQTNRIAVGCIWSCLDCGDDYVRFCATAATTGMSVLFAQSPSIRDTFVQIGQEACAALVAFDDGGESGDHIGIWPREGRIEFAPSVDESSNSDLKFDVDRYCGALVAGRCVE
jgi:hypothetical protein